MREFKKYFFEGLLQLTILAALMRQNVLPPPRDHRFLDYFTTWYPDEHDPQLATANFSSLVDHLTYHHSSSSSFITDKFNTNSSNSTSRLSEELRSLNRLNARLQQQQHQQQQQQQQVLKIRSSSNVGGGSSESSSVSSSSICMEAIECQYRQLESNLYQ